MAATIFIDGEAGTTGLQIKSRIEGRDGLDFIRLEGDRRKDPTARREALNAADIVILCLPDDAAKEAVHLIDNPNTRVIDASSAHRIAPGWAYGFPEYAANSRSDIASSTRVTNPGCYAITSVAMLHPLVQAGLVPADWPVTINAVSGYSGGGKQLIAAFEDPASTDHTDEAFRVYGLGLAHKHVPEIQTWGGLTHRPLFVPSVGRFVQGMLVQIPLQLWALPKKPSVEEIHAALETHYAGQTYVSVTPLSDSLSATKLDPEALNGTNQLRLHVIGNATEGQAVVIGQLDNLGKGASGQAVQNLNIMLGLPEGEGLDRTARIE
ncbi:MAG TPA: N-acetyl-gamma-glutamyl-phosphate reductase [Rhodospirillaceae bacterium]|nr:N-acetyl-gamma-glutamyl-phosphate reductase [Rhodospirillaceae bacterium]MAX62145.1 N-acetyl-gamma-glutamyl-phosphate reductase [Rhodospirillaceae bacterium]MBB56705.1 N-acetyl-gamma-glutamyl-phosphate reductase [Rhodospirillaceae bacterium]HAE03346.1 N-acetyl-gamma-glutamyl-phosphate reductase [Rhodospirillaceae bacterium]HAJ21774.1 N-acetyl-gamma-glutamyl-phosphate reductase [Rhodospirillaceae bacterium]|tara:strand:+ start:136022 stop:136990 length:969 start_codon:yes stop_codon:yes gene_type:complete